MANTDSTSNVSGKADNGDAAAIKTQLPSNTSQQQDPVPRIRKKNPSWTQQKPVPEHVKRMKEDLDDLGFNFEAVLSDALACMQTQLTNKSDGVEDTNAELIKMAADWKAANRDHMQSMVAFLERRGMLPFGSVSVPSEPLKGKQGDID